MKNLIKNTGGKIYKSPLVQNGCLLCRVFHKVAEVLALGGVGGWLIYRSQDTITIGVGVALSLWALVKLVNIAYRAESHKNGKVRN